MILSTLSMEVDEIPRGEEPCPLKCAEGKGFRWSKKNRGQPSRLLRDIRRGLLAKKKKGRGEQSLRRGKNAAAREKRSCEITQGKRGRRESRKKGGKKGRA